MKECEDILASVVALVIIVAVLIPIAPFAIVGLLLWFIGIFISFCVGLTMNMCRCSAKTTALVMETICDVFNWPILTCCDAVTAVGEWLCTLCGDESE